MKTVLRTLGFGFAIWFVPFTMGMALYPILSTESALFDSIMSVTLTFSAALCSYLYFKEQFMNAGVLSAVGAGLLWVLLAMVLDAPMFLLSDIADMTTAEYFADIGFGYLTIPIVAMAVVMSLRLGRRRGAAAEH